MLDSLKLRMTPMVWKNDVADHPYGTLEIHEYFHRTFGVVWSKRDDGRDDTVKLPN